VQYGLTPSFGTYSTLDATLVTNHSVTLGGLSPATTYYFQVISSPDGVNNYTGAGLFTTTNLPNGGSGLVFGVTNVWRWSGANNDAVPTWKSATFVDSSWFSGPGLLWADNRGIGWCADCVPQNTQMSLDPSTGSVYPYPTYYFRTHFRFTNNPVGATLTFSNFVEDGGIFYLNGTELFRIRMPAGAISNATLSTSFPCANNYPSGSPCRGVATTNCPDVIPISGDLITNLIQGDNVLAVEVHNQRANSPDINFGAALYYTMPVSAGPAPPFLTNVLATAGETNATITWTTLANSSSQVQYGLTPSMGTFTTLDSTLVANHSVNLSGLLRTNLYYFQVISTLLATQYTGTGTFFTAPFYQAVIPLTDDWSFTTNNLDGVNWRNANFIDSSWLDGFALLWVDLSGNPNPLVQPRNTQMPANETTHLPWTAYYFRNHLNGKEIQRLRLPAAPTVITNGTVATATNSAVAADVFRLWGNQLTNLAVGTNNIMAVEVHNGGAGSLDVTFGSAMGLVRALAAETTLHISYTNHLARLLWDGSYLTLQQATNLLVPNAWSDVSPPVTGGFYSVNVGNRTVFYRLRD
ncbi:MAG: fibronectin type III domain-containing protein, partial [Verrucomicrobia bacterium]|nr:fibronectin type III domain-containing protein [Verrucomicrobiota bacterium]